MGLLNNLIIMHVTRRSSNTMLSPPHGQGARKHVTRRASSTMLSPPHGQGATIRQFGPTQRATLSTQRTTVKWLLLLGLVTLAVAPNPTIERLKRASVQMHTYQRRPLVSRAALAACRRRRLMYSDPLGSGTLVKNGWIKKKAGLSWKKRWLVLEKGLDNSNRLRYHETDTAQKTNPKDLKGEILISTIERVDKSDHDKKKCINIHLYKAAGGRTYHFECDNPLKWEAAIIGVIQF